MNEGWLRTWTKLIFCSIQKAERRQPYQDVSLEVQAPLIQHGFHPAHVFVNGGREHGVHATTANHPTVSVHPIKHGCKERLTSSHLSCSSRKQPLNQQSFQPPCHFIVLPRAFHSIFLFHLIVFFIEKKNVFALVLKLKIAYSNTRTQAHSQAVVLLVVVLQVGRILLSSNTSSKANYGLCAETGKTAAAMTNFSGFMKPTELLTAVIFGRFAAVFFLTDRISVHF